MVYLSTSIAAQPCPNGVEFFTAHSEAMAGGVGALTVLVRWGVGRCEDPFRQHFGGPTATARPAGSWPSGPIWLKQLAHALYAR